MVSSTSAANNLTVAGTASGDYALKVMTVVALVMTPVVLLYQGWSYWVFRARRRFAGRADVRQSRVQPCALVNDARPPGLHPRRRACQGV